MANAKQDTEPGDLYVCEECGDAIESPDNTRECPKCGGHLRNTAITHD